MPALSIFSRNPSMITLLIEAVIWFWHLHEVQLLSSKVNASTEHVILLWEENLSLLPLLCWLLSAMLTGFPYVVPLFHQWWMGNLSFPTAYSRFAGHEPKNFQNGAMQQFYAYLSYRFLIRSSSTEPSKVNGICLWSDRKIPMTSKDPKVVSITSVCHYKSLGSLCSFRISKFE